MAIPGSLDYGSVSVNMTWKGQSYHVKVYPRLVHVIKSFNSRLQGEPVTTLYGLRRRLEACNKMIHHLSTVPDSEMRGLRVEVTVSNDTLAGARAHVDTLPFADINWWINPPAGFESYKLDMKVVTKETLIDNARWVYDRAVNLGMITGDNSAAPARSHRQVSADVLCALGWNAGRSRVTKSLSSSAWWRGDVSSGDTPNYDDTNSHLLLMKYLTKTYHDPTTLKKLWAIIKREIGYIPCKKAHENDDTHQYYRWGWTPLRLHCEKGNCGHNLYGPQVYDWFAQLVMKGRLTKEAIGMPSDPQPASDDLMTAITTAEATTTTTMDTLSHLLKNFSSDEQLSDLIKIIKDELPGNIILTVQHPEDFNHYYTIHKWRPNFRMRCSIKNCKDSLPRANTYQYFADMVDNGLVSREAVGLPAQAVSAWLCCIS